MRKYNCWVNVGGTDDTSQPTTVRKIGISAGEVQVLRSLFGTEAVTDIRQGEMDQRSHKKEREHLDAKYGKHRTDPVLGLAGVKLPLELDGDFPGLDEDEATDAPEPDFGGKMVVAPKEPQIAAA